MKFLLIALVAAGSLWVCGCGTMSTRSGYSDKGSRISGLKGRTLKDGESRSLYSTKGQQSREDRARDAAKARKKGPIKIAHDTTLIAVNDPVKRQNFIKWDTQPGWYYTLMYRRRGNSGAWQLLPNAINLPGTGRDMKVIDNLPTHMDHAYNVDVSPVKRKAQPARRSSR